MAWSVDFLQHRYYSLLYPEKKVESNKDDGGWTSRWSHIGPTSYKADEAWPVILTKWGAPRYNIGNNTFITYGPGSSPSKNDEHDLVIENMKNCIVFTTGHVNGMEDYRLGLRCDTWATDSVKIGDFTFRHALPKAIRQKVYGESGYVVQTNTNGSWIDLLGMLIIPTNESTIKGYFVAVPWWYRDNKNNTDDITRLIPGRLDKMFTLTDQNVEATPVTDINVLNRFIFGWIGITQKNWETPLLPGNTEPITVACKTYDTTGKVTNANATTSVRPANAVTKSKQYLINKNSIEKYKQLLVGNLGYDGLEKIPGMHTKYNEVYEHGLDNYQSVKSSLTKIS